MSVPTIKLPADLPTTASLAKKWRWEKKFMKTLYYVLQGQCSEALKHRIQVTQGYKRCMMTLI